ncbi:MAG: hypothetical protein NC347_07100 [Clostridium sp.]|nr:hypothetical protein [Clostridium sp.]
MGPKQPVSVAGIEFDAVLDIKESHSSTVPQYPIDEGYSVQDNVALDPMSLVMTLYVTATPVTWLSRHGSGEGRVRQIWNQLFGMYSQKTPITVITPDASYSNMIIKGITYKKSSETGYAAEIPIEFSQVTVTSARTAAVPAEYARAGMSQQLAGSAATSTATSSGSTAGTGSGGGSSNGGSAAKQSGSLLYQMAEGVGNSTGWYSLN